MVLITSMVVPSTSLYLIMLQEPLGYNLASDIRYVTNLKDFELLWLHVKTFCGMLIEICGSEHWSTYPPINFSHVFYIKGLLSHRVLFWVGLPKTFSYCNHCNIHIGIWGHILKFIDQGGVIRKRSYFSK